MRLTQKVVTAMGVALLLALPGCAGRGGTVAGTPPTTGAPTGAPTSSPSPSQPVPDPTGTWRMLPPAPVPVPDTYAAVWTGTEMIVHGFRLPFDRPEDRPTTVDLAYNPSTGRWRVLPSSPYVVEANEGGFLVVWTGTEMLTFGWSNAAYNPRTNRWRPLPPGGAGSSAVVWTGRQVLTWGGGCCGEQSNNGSAFNPATGIWQAIPTAPISGRHAPGAWTGRELIVVGGMNDTGALRDAAAYNPSTRTWRKLPAMPAARMDATLSWTGTELLVVGGHSTDHWPWRIYRSALAYSPATNRWRSLPDMPMARFGHGAVWTGRQLLVWGGQTMPFDERTDTHSTPPHGLAYTPATNLWSALPAAPLRGRTPEATIWTGHEMIIFGGRASRPPFQEMRDGAAYRPATAG